MTLFVLTPVQYGGDGDQDPKLMKQPMVEGLL
jgi:hypothetical protein